MAPSQLRHARHLGAVMAMPDVGMLLHMAPHGNANEQNQAENADGGQAHDLVVFIIHSVRLVSCRPLLTGRKLLSLQE